MLLAVVCSALGKNGPRAGSVGNAPEFLDRDVDYVAWRVPFRPFLAAGGGKASRNPCPGHRVQVPQAQQAGTARMRETVRALVPQRKTRSIGPSRCSACRVRTAAATSGGVACGQDSGLELRS